MRNRWAPADGFPQPALGLRLPHLATPHLGWDARRRLALRVAVRALATAGLRADAWRDTTLPRRVAGCCSTSALISWIRRCALFGPPTRRLRRDRHRRGTAGRRRCVYGTPPSARARGATSGCPRLRRRPGRGCGCSDPKRATSYPRATDRRRPCDPVGGRAIRIRGEPSPKSRWGRLVRGDESDPVPSERGAWPSFYSGLARALREGGPPPVDPHDAIATLEVLETARSGSRQNPGT